jgi:hypothetical protein
MTMRLFYSFPNQHVDYRLSWYGIDRYGRGRSRVGSASSYRPSPRNPIAYRRLGMVLSVSAFNTSGTTLRPADRRGAACSHSVTDRVRRQFGAAHADRPESGGPADAVGVLAALPVMTDPGHSHTSTCPQYDEFAANLFVCWPGDHPSARW